MKLAPIKTNNLIRHLRSPEGSASSLTRDFHCLVKHRLLHVKFPHSLNGAYIAVHPLRYDITKIIWNSQSGPAKAFTGDLGGCYFFIMFRLAR
jgi:hypothetical protein